MKVVLSVVLVCLFALAFPLAGGAGGWAGSRYAKSECTYDRASNTLFCETVASVEYETTEALAFPDASCPNGTRGVGRTGVFVEVWRVFDVYQGHTPVRKHNLFGNETPLFEQWGWKSFTDTELGCV